MLTELFRTASPRLADGYRDLLLRWTTAHVPDLDDLSRSYVRYALGDDKLPRPLLMLIGYGATRPSIDADLVAEVGEVIYVPQVVRDFLAIHDDIVDGDVEKFGQATLPAALAALPNHGESSPVVGEHLALYWADLLLGLVADLIDSAATDAEGRRQLSGQVGRSLRRTQRGQLTELLLQDRPPAEVQTSTLLRLYADKAAEYCYVLPFELGAVLGGLDDEQRRDARSVLELIGVASQIVDDIAGGCPHAVDSDRDTVGEILELRRTVLLCELARALPADAALTRVLCGRTATAEQAAEIREAFLTSGAVATAATAAGEIAGKAEAELGVLDLAEPAATYLHDLIDTRVSATLARIGC